ncbi:ribosome silencing factor [Jonesia denitrificans]|uniref:Ribosomal silencing factor RsfS n=1 Tax=Jonesia denitrificans (strain ATCC 14870 / DSM 20603 / BCRC 15368 / CIP 55.134 / JCM 11481 / NBRC 15587 / NCTC 10816 / Prevot 55134) TaxID=471856 RepID=C7R5L6_JONDD|nr:ribosome silencing factor [Jonesia denitrificans]ACV09289.1 iojap-like protein [Jonesia denitrificans DSM 20603]ASE09450.1 ribosome silencing factor [Jonesia denitrificans]QXB43995.1 ribosome silencing factor [Jonesia denitrificans]SQH21533.1 ribosome-associated protein [Jonesia denitrificans]
MAATDHAIDLAITAARAASDKKASEIIALDVSDHLVLTDAFVIASGNSERQVSAIVDAVERALHEAGTKLVRREGKGDARWVLLDFGDIVVHVQHQEDRAFYALEKLWGDCPSIELPEDARGGDGGPEEEELDEFGFPKNF